MLKISLCSIVLLLLLWPSHVTSSSVRHRRDFFPRPPGPYGCRFIPKCDPTAEYRTADGTCNNLASPLDGAAHTPFKRYLPPQYENGDQPRGESYLPSPRTVSTTMSSVSTQRTMSPNTLLVMQWGQFMDHDFTFTPESEGFSCCDDGHDFTKTDPDCRPLNVTGDPFYSQFDIQCLNFVRSMPVDSSCTPGHREQVNALTAFADGSNVYGSTLEEQIGLRMMSDGLLKMGPGEELSTGACNVNQTTCRFPFLPVRKTKSGVDEFFAGDRRTEEQPGLTSMHTLLMRTHNAFASQVLQMFPTFDDEKIFQETRRIIVAIIEHITYNEYVPSVIGFRTAGQFKLLPRERGLGASNIYDPSRFNATTPNVFASAAFRFAHSLISDVFVLPENEQIVLAESFKNHNVTTTFGRYPSDILRGLSGDLAERMDHFVVRTLTNKLFAIGPDFSYGSDLYSRNIMRAREHGIPPYTAWRKYFNLFQPKNFDDLKIVMPIGPAMALRSIYRSVDDIDVFAAAISEFPVDSRDGILGHLLTQILATHFRDIKYGDRFFYENTKENPRPFTHEQLDIIRNTTLSSLMCAYMDTPFIQRYVMQVPSFTNPILSCSTILSGTVPDRIERLLALNYLTDNLVS